MRIILIATILASGIGCSTVPSSQANPAACRGIWEWSAAINGDKPGSGSRFVVSDEGITGTFYLLDPNRPLDFSAAGQTVPLADLRKTGCNIAFTIRLATGTGEYIERLTLKLDNDPTGNIGDEIRGRLESNDKQATPIDVVVVRRK